MSAVAQNNHWGQLGEEAELSFDPTHYTLGTADGEDRDAQVRWKVAAADKIDYSDAVREAEIGDAEVTRAGQIYERLFYLFQDGNAPQEPWQDLQNPFPHWPDWHVDPGKIGFNQDRQASPSEWRGQGGDEPPDTAIYVLPVQDKASARHAVYALAVGRSR
jgi:hypothetical protein